MFGLSFVEVGVIGFVGLLAVGPHRLERLSRPLYDLGAWIRKRWK